MPAFSQASRYFTTCASVKYSRIRSPRSLLKCEPPISGLPPEIKRVTRCEPKATVGSAAVVGAGISGAAVSPAAATTAPFIKSRRDAVAGTRIEVSGATEESLPIRDHQGEGAIRRRYNGYYFLARLSTTFIRQALGDLTSGLFV